MRIVRTGIGVAVLLASLWSWVALSGSQATLLGTGGRSALPTARDELPALDASHQVASCPTLFPQPFDGSGVVARVFFSGDSDLHALARTLDVWEVNRDDGSLVALIRPDQLASLRAARYRIDVDVERTALLTEPRLPIAGQDGGIPGFPCYRTVEETFSDAAAMAATYPDLATWIDVGDSWEKTVDPDAGNDLWVLRLTNATVSTPKPKLFVMSSIHAREYAPAELNLRFAEYLIANYDVDPDVTWLLDFHEIHLLLHANPDARKYAETGLYSWRYWRKNTNNNFCSNSDLRGVDLNRNFEFQWACCGGSSPFECIETYHGPGAASEPEVQAIQDYLRDQFPDQRDTPISATVPLTATGVFLDLHSHGGLVLWPWGFQRASAPNEIGLATFGRRLAIFNGYQAQSAYELYLTDGDTVDFSYGELGLAAYVFELGTAFFESCVAFEGGILPANLEALLYAAKVVRSPYLTPAGPDAANLRLEPAEALPGQTVVLFADISQVGAGLASSVQTIDAPLGAVAAAEFFIDVPPWIPTTAPVAAAMVAADGAFGDPTEAVIGTISTLSLSPGRHTVFVRAQNDAGDWGPFSAVFLSVRYSHALFLPVAVRQ